MAYPRFFIKGSLPRAENDPVPLDAEDLHHLAEVLRVRGGERLVLADSDGTVTLVEVVSASARGLFVRPLERLPRTWEPHVTLVLGVAKGGKVDDAVEGAVEVGVQAVWPVTFTRDVVKLDPRKARKRAERWRRVAMAAAKQSQRAVVPDVREVMTFETLAAELGRFALVLVAWEEARGVTVRDAIAAAGLDPAEPVAVVVGSEGGLTGAEVGRLQGAGAQVVSLGPTILRAETAGVVAPALTVAELHALHGAREGGPA